VIDQLAKHLEVLKQHLGILLRGMLIIPISMYYVAAWLCCGAAVAQGGTESGSDLQPISPYGSDIESDYHKRVYQNLLGEGYFDLWMLVYPTIEKNSAEFAVAISRKSANVDRIDELPYFVIVSRAKMALESSNMRLGKSTVRVDSTKPPPVTDTKADIDRADASNFIDTWFSALKTAKYSDEANGFDGVIYEFYSHRRAGTAWNPESGIPGQMAKSGDCLIRYVKAPIKVRESIMQECRKINDKLMELTKK
jgi:hypothetical protein